MRVMLTVAVVVAAIVVVLSRIGARRLSDDAAYEELDAAIEVSSLSDPARMALRDHIARERARAGVSQGVSRTARRQRLG